MARNVLDNVVWHAMSGPQQELAERRGSAGRFHPDVSPFAAVADPDSAQGWTDLAQLVGPGRAALLFAPDLEAPPGWTREHAIPCLQMVAEYVTEHPDTDGFIDLTLDDTPEMLQLVSETQPGPFGSRTIEMGRYLGVRSEGRLIAMSGERFRIPGFTEVSAVCTAPDHRGRGLARRLVLAVVENVRSAGNEAILHVASDNEPAIALYRSLGFSVRRESEALILRRDAD
ncbi:MAG: GNAT family N-acetyltransferase [Actinomycetota bacterium]